MKIVYVSQYFPPEMGAGSARVSELSRHWVEAGHDVTVLTGFPNYPTGEVHPHYKREIRRLTMTERWQGVKVVRTWLWPLPNRKSWERISNYTSFFISAIARGLFLRRSDAIVATSPQLLVGLAGWALARLKRVPVVLEVRDIWPDAILASDVSRPGSLLDKALSAISRFLYKRCDHIVVVTPAFVEELVTRWDVPKDKVSLVMNGVETDTFTPGDGSPMRTSLGLEGRFVVSYVGTVGYAHGIGTVLAAAERAKDELPEVTFLVVGEGAEREHLQSAARGRGLDNIMFAGQMPREQIPDVLNASDAALVLLKRTDAFKQVIPTKMLEFMSSGTPVVLGVEGQARDIVEAAGGGVYIEPENVDQLLEATATLRDSEELRSRLGSSGRAHMVAEFSRARTARDYVDILQDIAR